LCDAAKLASEKRETSVNYSKPWQNKSIFSAAAGSRSSAKQRGNDKPRNRVVASHSDG
jgi:hypothetical protein